MLKPAGAVYVYATLPASELLAPLLFVIATVMTEDEPT